MRKCIISLVAVLLANATLAWAQDPDTPLPPPRSLNPFKNLFTPKQQQDQTDAAPATPPSSFNPFRKTPAPQSESTSTEQIAPPRSFNPFKRLITPQPEKKEGAEPKREGEGEAMKEAEEEEEEAKRVDRWWFRTEALIWWLKDARLPALVTSGDLTDPRPGALGQPNTVVLFGGGGQDFFTRYGTRLSAGYWFDVEHLWGVDASYFFVAGVSVGQNFGSAGNPPLARPFFNANTGQQDASVVTYPGVSNGGVLVTLGSFLQSAEINMSHTLAQDRRYRIQALAGIRYLNLNESLNINETDNFVVTPQYNGQPIPFAGQTVSVADNFSTRNHFFGAQIGTRAEFDWTERFTLGMYLKVALGDTHEIANLQGSTVVSTSPATVYHAGLLNLASNSGNYYREAFSIVPEAGLNLRFKLSNHVTIFGGYTFIYWSNILRPGDQVDTTINTNQVPTSSTYGTAGGPIRPLFSFHATDFFAHGANAGLEIHF